MKEKILEKFDKLTPNFSGDSCEETRAFLKNNTTLYTEEAYPESELELDIEKVKDFISQALDEYGAEKYERGYLDGKNNQPKGLNK